MGQNDFPVPMDASPDYFFLIIGDEEGKLYVYKVSLHFVFYPPAFLLEMVELLRLEPVVLLLHSVFVAQGYL